MYARNITKASENFDLIEDSSLTSPMTPLFSGVDSVGTISSALVTYAAIQALKPDLIINAGTAGGFKVGTLFSYCFWKYCYRSFRFSGFVL